MWALLSALTWNVTDDLPLNVTPTSTYELPATQNSRPIPTRDHKLETKCLFIRKRAEKKRQTNAERKPART